MTQKHELYFPPNYITSVDELIASSKFVEIISVGELIDG
jgi:hypothetical protein